MAGASISKVLLVSFGILVWQPTHRGPSFTINANLFCQASSNAGSHTKLKLAQSLKSVKDSVWSGDGRFDSMGHSAKYGVYTMFCCTIMKIVIFKLLQVSISSSKQDVSWQLSYNSHFAFELLLPLSS